MSPANWWHRQEGGKIAEERPAPPGADQPYPNISTVPAKPEAPNAEALKKLTDSLIADRTNAQHAAQSAPLADPSLPSASPNLFGVGAVPPPPPTGAATGKAPVASASLPAVTAPPPAAAPRKEVQRAPLEPRPTPAAAPPQQQPRAVARSETTPQLPALPNGAPERPAVAGAPPAPVAATSAAAPPSSGTAPSASIVFLQGASALSQPAAQEVKAFAAKRGNATIAVTGYGDSASSDPAAQSAALNLGLSRAQSIVEALHANGVPGDAIRVNAEASGRGAALHLLQ